MKQSKFAFVIVLALLGILFSGISPAFANTPEPAKPVPGLGKVTDSELRAIWLKKRAWYDNQTQVIRDAYRIGAYFDSLIGLERTRGRDVGALEDAVSKYYKALADAEAARVDANNLFSRNAGFDIYYNILDRQLAGQSIVDAHNSLKSVHIILVVATRDFNQAYSAWRKRYIHPITPTP
jgi:hypothetical protein